MGGTIMNKATYDKINDYCTTKYEGVLVQAERDFVLRKFLDSYYEAVDKYKEVHMSDPSPVEEQTIIDSLLIESTLISYIDSAKKYYEEFRTNVENDFKKKQERPIFWKNVATSILANFIYSIILIIIFFVAKDQIASWLIQLGS